MSSLILDIETAGRDIDSFDDDQREYLLANAQTEEEIQQAIENLSFYPQTAEIVAIGLLNPDTNKGAVYYQASGQLPMQFEENGITYLSGSEQDILKRFWDTVKSYKSIVTFNGRAFDCPFILIRSALHKIRPTKELIPNRYADQHIDLMDRLSFYGAQKRRFSLDMWCRTFGIKSPKDDISGYQVKELYKAGRYLDIAKYCAKDLFATSELYLHWQKYLSPPF